MLADLRFVLDLISSIFVAPTVRESPGKIRRSEKVGEFKSTSEVQKLTTVLKKI